MADFLKWECLGIGWTLAVKAYNQVEIFFWLADIQKPGQWKKDCCCLNDLKKCAAEESLHRSYITGFRLTQVVTYCYGQKQSVFSSEDRNLLFSRETENVYFLPHSTVWQSCFLTLSLFNKTKFSETSRNLAKSKSIFDV